jgi:hypothetical protein
VNTAICKQIFIAIFKMSESFKQKANAHQQSSSLTNNCISTVEHDNIIMKNRLLPGISTGVMCSEEIECV